MANDLFETVNFITEKIGDLAQIRRRYKIPPEDIKETPCVIGYPAFGSWESQMENEKQGLHTITVLVLFHRKNYERDIPRIQDLGELVSDTLLGSSNVGLSTYGDTIGLITYTFGEISYNEKPFIGWQFEIQDTKIRKVIS